MFSSTEEEDNVDDPDEVDVDKTTTADEDSSEDAGSPDASEGGPGGQADAEADIAAETPVKIKTDEVRGIVVK